MCRRSAHHYVFGDHCGKHLVTKDEHTPENPAKPFPDNDYLKILLECYLISAKLLKPKDAKYVDPDVDLEKLYQSGIICIEKSRQIMATWLTCAYLSWRARYYPHQLIMVQSKREEDAANLVFNKDPHLARISYVESNLPKHLKMVRFPSGGSYAHLYYPNGSHIWGIPEGGDIIRSNTPSVVFSDEAAFQPQFGQSYTAAMPAIKGGGQYIAVSSAEPGEFQTLVEST